MYRSERGEGIMRSRREEWRERERGRGEGQSESGASWDGMGEGGK